MRQYIDTLQDVNGNALIGAAVLVQNFLGGANASIYSDNGLTPILTSTVTTGADGQFSFFAADGNYNLVMSKNSTVFKTQSPVVLFDSAAQLTYTDTGAVNAYAIANSDLEKALRVGLRASIKATNTSTGASTFQYNGLAVKGLVLPAAAALNAGSVQAGGIYGLEYDGTNWQLRNSNVSSGVSYAQTTIEVGVGVVPTNFSINPDYLDPRRYGAVGNGVLGAGGTDDTAALNQWVQVVNATPNPVSTWPVGLLFLCQPLNAITANNFTWNMNSTLLAKANSWNITGSAFSYLVAISGTGARLNSVSLNGNQAAFSVNAPFGYLLRVTGGDVLMDNCNLTNSPSGIASFESIAQGRFCNSHFDGSVNSVNISACSYLKFVNCTANLDGYPFGTAVVPGVPQSAGGFGWSLRFRSHHITFTNCESMQCCLVGFNIDQGCYAIKMIGCLAWMNGDAGIALAADNTSPGTPGNSEDCYDCEFIDCESYNNWGGGLVAYAPTFNCTVDGGRYYNNQRSAGILAAASSAISGIYMAGGSLGVRIRTKAYDDRQLSLVTVVSGTSPRVLTASGWVAGSAGNYPRVALYNSSKVFQGWGTISAEGTGVVQITTTAFNGVTLANIAAGWYVSQRVQSNGVWLDNGCTGILDVDGFGFLMGALGGGTLTGYKTLGGVTGSGQNIYLPGATADYNELLANPTFDAGITNWTFSTPGGGSSSSSTLLLPAASASQTVANPGVFTTATQAWVAGTPVVITGTPPGGFAAGITYYVLATGLTTTACELAIAPGGTALACTSSSACTLTPLNARSPAGLLLVAGSSAATGDATMATDALNYAGGAWVETSIWANALNAGDCQLILFWNSVGTGLQFSSVDHPGGGWRQLKIGGFLPTPLTTTSVRVQVQPNKTVYFDTATYRVKCDAFDERDFSYPTRNLPV